MQKALIIIFLTFNFSCSVERFGSKPEPICDEIRIQSIIEKTKRNNITNKDFFIEKGEISIKSKNDLQRFMFTVKHKKPDTYLISIKNSIGIEGARIFLSGDSVLVNDRINRRLLYGTTKSVNDILGLPLVCFKMAFGDIMIEQDSSNRQTAQVNSRLILSQNIFGMKAEAQVNARICKVNLVEYGKGSENGEILFKYSKFSRKEKTIPAVIEIVNKEKDQYIKISIKKIQLPWTGELEFIKGTGYKIEEIK